MANSLPRPITKAFFINSKGIYILEEATHLQFSLPSNLNNKLKIFCHQINAFHNHSGSSIKLVYIVSSIEFHPLILVDSSA